MKVFMVALVGLGLLAVSAAADDKDTKAAPKASGELKDFTARLSYSVGLDIGTKLKGQAVEFDPDVLTQGIKDAMTGKPKMNEQQIRETLTEFQKVMTAKREEMIAKQSQVFDKVKKEGEAFLAANKKKPGVKTTASGLQYEVLKEGTGKSPAPTDMVTVNYEGRLIDGTVFDSSYKRGEPASFSVNQVIKGWTEALQLMKVGSKYKLFIPSELAYGATPRAGGAIRPHDTLIFDVELLKID